MANFLDVVNHLFYRYQIDVKTLQPHGHSKNVMMEVLQGVVQTKRILAISTMIFLQVCSTNFIDNRTQLEELNLHERSSHRPLSPANCMTLKTKFPSGKTTRATPINWLSQLLSRCSDQSAIRSNFGSVLFFTSKQFFSAKRCFSSSFRVELGVRNRGSLSSLSNSIQTKKNNDR